MRVGAMGTKTIRKEDRLPEENKSRVYKPKSNAFQVDATGPDNKDTNKSYPHKNLFNKRKSVS
jgi:hypothetical protein